MTGGARQNGARTNGAAGADRRHLLFLPYPAYGHMVPVLPVIAELVSRGHHATCFTTEQFLDEVRATGARAARYDPPLSSAPPPDVIDADESARAPLKLLKASTAILPSVEAAFDGPPDAVLYDTTLWLTGRLLAARWERPTVQLSATFASNEHFSLGGMHEQFAGKIDPAHPALAEFTALLTDVITGSGLPEQRQAEIFHGHDEFTIGFVPKEFQFAAETFDERHVFVGPTIGSRPAAQPWPAPPDGVPQLVVSLGTTVNNHPDFFRQCVRAFGELPWHTVLALGGRVAVEELGDLPPNVEAHRWIPLGSALERTTVFLCQSGMGSILESLYAGVPMVVVPHHPEQHVNAQRLTELGLATVVQRGQVTPESLRAAVLEVAGDAGMRARVREMSAHVRTAGGAPLAADAIERHLGPARPAMAMPVEREYGCPFDPPTAYATLREQCPVAPLALTAGPGDGAGWLVTGYAEARAVLADDRFSHRNELIGLAIEPPFPIDGYDPPAAGPGAFIKMDAPQHTHYRRMLTGRFTMRAIAGLTPMITRITHECLDEMAGAAGRGPVDLVRLFAEPLPERVMCGMLGVPDAAGEVLSRHLAVLSRRTFAVEELISACTEIAEQLQALVAERTAAPGGDLISTLAAGGALSRDELVNIVWALLGGGFDTTANMLALGTFALLTHPEQLMRLRERPDSTDHVVEELLRYLTISHLGASRAALQDVELGGARIRKGDTVVVALPAANRDPAQFAEPDRLDAAAGARAHLAFGHGLHQCLGQNLARSILRIGYPALFERFPTLRLATAPEDVRTRTDMLHYGVHELLVTWDGARG